MLYFLNEAISVKTMVIIESVIVIHTSVNCTEVWDNCREWVEFMGVANSVVNKRRVWLVGVIYGCG